MSEPCLRSRCLGCVRTSKRCQSSCTGPRCCRPHCHRSSSLRKFALLTPFRYSCSSPCLDSKVQRPRQEPVQLGQQGQRQATARLEGQRRKFAFVFLFPSTRSEVDTHATLVGPRRSGSVSARQLYRWARWRSRTWHWHIWHARRARRPLCRSQGLPTSRTHRIR